jgi:hypothetical protein
VASTFKFKPHLDPERRQPAQTLYTIDFRLYANFSNFLKPDNQVSWAGNEP